MRAPPSSTPHPLLDLLARPNPRQDGAAFLEALYAHLLLAGNAYVEAVTLDGRLRELYALRPDRMRVVPGPDGWPAAYEYAVGRAQRALRAERSRCRRSCIWRSSIRSTIITACRRSKPRAVALDVHNAASAWNKALLDNAARPSGALVYSRAENGAMLSEKQFERLQARAGGRIIRARRMPGGRCCSKAGSTGRRCRCRRRTWISSRPKHSAAREIALAFGVPPMLLGIPGDNTYANYREANRAFWRQTVLPLAARIGAALSQWLAPAFGGEVRLAVDTDRIEALAADRAALWARVTKAPFLTLNEKRDAVGLRARSRAGIGLVEPCPGRSEASVRALRRTGCDSEL